MIRYPIYYDSPNYFKKEYLLNFNNKEIKLLLIPIDYNSDKYNWDFISKLQINQLDNLLYKLPDSCFYDEILSYDSYFFNSKTISSKYPIRSTGNLFVFYQGKVIGYLCFKYLSNYVFIENVCLAKEFRGKGLFKTIFIWFMNEIQNNVYSDDTNFKGFRLTVWDQSPFNKNKEIIKLYQKFGFKIFNEEKYSEKRLYIHMNKNI